MAPVAAARARATPKARTRRRSCFNAMSLRPRAPLRAREGKWRAPKRCPSSSGREFPGNCGDVDGSSLKGSKPDRLLGAVRDQWRRLIIRPLDVEAVKAAQGREEAHPKERDGDRAETAEHRGGNRAEERGGDAGLKLPQLVGGADEEPIHR